MIPKCSFLTIIQTIAVSIFVLSSSSGSSDDVKLEKTSVCKTTACKKSASFLKSCMNTNAHPCEDFYEYACGNFKNIRPPSAGKERQEWFSEVQITALKEVRDYLKMKNLSTDPKAIRKARMLYRLCRDEDSVDEYGMKALQDYLTQVGLSTETLQQCSEQSRWPWFIIAARIKKFLNIDFLFEISVQKDPSDPTKKRISLSRPEKFNFLLYFNYQYLESAKLDRSALGECRHFINDVLTELEYQTLSVERLNRIHLFEQAVSRILDQTKDENFVLMSISNLQRITDKMMFQKDAIELNWLEFLNYLFNGRLDGTETICVADINYLKKIMIFLSQVDYVTICYAMLWEVFTKLLPNSNQELSYSWNIYLSIISGDVIGMARGKYCVNVLVNKMGIALAYKYIQYDNGEEKMNQVLSMMQNIYDSTKNSAKRLHSCSTNFCNEARKRINTLKMYIGFPRLSSISTMIDEYYAHVRVIRNHFLKSLIETEKIIVNENFEALFDVDTVIKEEFMMNPINIRTFYSTKTNSVYVPMAILHFPFYDHGLQALNYGALGTILGHEMAHSFDVSELDMEFQPGIQCFKKYYSDYKIEETNFQVNGSRTLIENISDNVGFRNALSGYRRFIKENGEELLLDGFEDLSHEKLFTLAYATSFCKNYNKLSLSEEINGVHPPHMVRVRAVTWNSYDFERIWNCRRNEQRRKCIIW